MRRTVISLNVKAADPAMGGDGVLVLPLDEVARIALTPTQITIRMVSDQRVFVFAHTDKLEELLAEHFVALSDVLDVTLVELR